MDKKNFLKLEVESIEYYVIKRKSLSYLTEYIDSLSSTKTEKAIDFDH